MENTNSTFDIGALNEKIERESAFVDVLSMEMNKVIVVGKKGTQKKNRDEDTQDAVNLYCKNQNATKDEIIAKGLSIFTIEFNSDNPPYVHLTNNKDEKNK